MDAPTAIQPNEATFVARLVDNGNLDTTATLVLGQVDAGTNLGEWRATVPTEVISEGLVNITVRGLTPNVVYFYRFVANNAVGEAWASIDGASGVFRTPQEVGEPAISQSSTPSRLEPSLATMAGTLIENGDQSTTVTLFYGPTDGGTSAGTWVNQQGLGVRAPGAFDTSITDFSGGEEIFFRFSAANSFGRAWAPFTGRFTAPVPPALPSITQQDGATGITIERGTVTATLVDDGDQPTSITVYFGTTDGGTRPADWASSTNLGTRAPGTYSIDLTSLPDGTRIFFRFVASNADGATWAGGNSGQFTTVAIPPPPEPPELTQQSATAITQTAATLPVQLVSTGGQTTSVRLHFGTTNGGTTPSAWDRVIQLGNQAPGNLEAAITGLQPSTRYFYRFEATNADGTTWATPEAVSFTTEAIPPPEPPELTQQGASAITQTAATLPGRLVSTGGQTTSVRVYLGTTNGGTTPSAWDRVIQLGNQVPGDLEALVTDLEPSTRYFYRFAATNADGTTWAAPGAVGSFTTADLPPPEITQQAASAITQTAATLLGRLVSTGGQTTSVRVYLGTTNGGTTPSSWDRVIQLGNQVPGNLETSVTDLKPDTLYFYRFEATSAGGTTWATPGAAASFTTEAIPPPEIIQQAVSATTQTSATLSARLVSTSGQATSVNVYFGTSSGGTSPSAWERVLELGTRTPGILEASLTNLDPETRYFYRFAATSAGGTTWAIPESIGSFTTAAPPPRPPMLSQNPPEFVGQTSALLTGALINDGDQPTTVRIYFGTTDGGAQAINWSQTRTLGVRPVGAFEIPLSSLSPETTYFHRFTAENDDGTVWASSSGTFTTASPDRLPIIRQNPAANVTANQARFTGTLVSDGQQATTILLYYGLSDGETNADNWGESSPLGFQPTGDFETQLTGLQPGTAYTFRFAATNPDGTAWAGASGEFTTAPAPLLSTPPKLTQDATPSIIGTTATLSGTLISDGDMETTVRLFYGTRDGGTIPGNWSLSAFLDAQEPGDFQVKVENLLPTTTYYFRFAATNADGTTWVDPVAGGTSDSFMTPVIPSPSALPVGAGLPRIQQDPSPSSLTELSATLTGTLVSDGMLPASVTVFYGTADGGTRATDWAQSIPVDLSGVGDFAVNIGGLRGGIAYFYRFRASNAVGLRWTSPTATFTTPPTSDADGDGLPDAWERIYGILSASNGSLDRDLDGYSDIDEFRANTSPIDPDSNLDILVTPTAGGLQVNWKSQPGRTYLIETADALGLGDTPTAWTGLGTGLTSGSFIDENPSLEMRVYRVRIEALK